MDFFQNQDVARRKTGRLVVFFGLAVISIIACVYLLAVGIIIMLAQRAEDAPAASEIALDPRLIGAVIGLTLIVIVGAALSKIAELRHGGSAVAESLGGRLLSHDGANANERRVLNIVDEMSIASGVPTPQVYVMDNETSINAFAAGYSPGDAAVGVTRGCIEQLSRDELQGVIAHEFSHVLNGDMRLNIRLIGLLHGILILGVIGYYMLYMARFSTVRSSSRSGGKGNAAPAILMLGGLGLMLVGSIGTFFGSLIKAAVSRQREFLADASAVQFTRNPAGIADALKRIGGLSAGSKILSPNAPQASHMFFGQAITIGFNAMFATHPPLPMRIRRIEPSWDGKFLPARTAPVSDRAPAKRSAGRLNIPGTAGLAGASAVSPDVTALVGHPSLEHLTVAAAVLDRLAGPLADATHEPFGAWAAVYAALLSSNPEVRVVQLRQIRSGDDRVVAREVERLAPLTVSLGSAERFAVVELAAPALRRMTREQYRIFAAGLERLALADNELSLFEWAVGHTLSHLLGAHFSIARTKRVHYYSLAGLGDACSDLLSALAYVGARDQPAAERAFATGRPALGAVSGLTLRPPGRVTRLDLDKAFDELNLVAPKLKRSLIEAAVLTIGADHVITPSEYELLRAIGAALDCPIPPLLPGQLSQT